MLQLHAVEPGTLALLKELMKKPAFEDFTLAGGTALALQIGHRISVDLDLFTPNEFNVDDVIDTLISDYPLIKIIYRGKNTLIVEISDIKVDFIRFRYSFQYPHIVLDGLRLFNTLDIALMKLDAINGRGRKKDFYDLYFLLKSYDLRLLLEKYKNMFHHDTVFQLIKSLTYFTDAESDPDPIVFDSNINWQKVKSEVIQSVRNLD
jgi:predicted nucleotidyltransferase component of viral defense system